MQLSEQEIVRRQNLQAIRDLGIDPFPAATFEVNTTAKEINETYDHHEEEEKRNLQNVRIAGRVMTKRVMGKAAFAVIQDSTTKVQIYVQRDMICPDENKDLYNKLFKKTIGSW